MKQKTNNNSSNSSSPPMEGLGEAIIQVENLTKQFGSFTAVKGITFDVYKGEIFGFLGANGAGKTTAMKMLIGISNPTSGKANVAGLDVATQADLVKKSIGYMSQKFSLYDDLTIKENITFFGGIYGLSRKLIKEKTQQLITKLEMQDVANNLVGSLPLGWKQKLSFSVALLHEPKIVFLDEPTVGVDVQSKNAIIDYLKKLNKNGTTIIYTSHHLSEAQDFCTDIAILDRGILFAQGTPSELIASTPLANHLEDVFIALTGRELRDDV